MVTMTMVMMAVPMRKNEAEAGHASDGYDVGDDGSDDADDDHAAAHDGHGDGGLGEDDSEEDVRI